ncbi:hypothetical protein XPA_001182 [Xanthoria parietina]
MNLNYCTAMTKIKTLLEHSSLQSAIPTTQNNNNNKIPKTMSTASPPEPSPLALHTHAFISAFIAGSPPSETLSKYFTPTASIHEHGPTWARSRLPFLAKTFTGRSSSPSPSSSSSSSSKPPPPLSSPPAPQPPNTNTTNNETPETMDDYYTHLASTLRFKPTPTTLPPLSAFNVDKEKGVVSVVLEGGFESVRTGRGWVETVCVFLFV